jgi:phosphoribosylamine-glycine ligase
MTFIYLTIDSPILKTYDNSRSHHVSSQMEVRSQVVIVIYVAIKQYPRIVAKSQDIKLNKKSYFWRIKNE